MSVTLNADTEEIIRRLVADGRYPDADALVQDALQLLESRQQQINELRAKIQVGLDELERGEFVEVKDEFWDEIDREVDEMLLRGDIPDPDVCP